MKKTLLFTLSIMVSLAMLAQKSTILEQDFSGGFGDWTAYSVNGDQVWEISETFGNPAPCAVMSGYDGEPFNNEDWLISPVVNFDDFTSEVLSFESATNYDGPDLELKLSTDYSGSGDPGSATWSDLSFILAEQGWDWYNSGDIDLSAITGSAYIAFKFTSTTSGSATWEIDNILLEGSGGTVYPEPSNYPTDFAGTQGISVINLSWADASGAQLPDGYVIFIATGQALATPTDGTPVADDNNLSDGAGALNVEFGVQSASFGSLNPNTNYDIAIYPYTNGGSDIDYKNDGTAPSLSLTTDEAVAVTILSTDFEGGSIDPWTEVSLSGSYIWTAADYNDNFFAKINGYGDDEASNDWLISPVINLETYQNEMLRFETAKNYDDVIEGLKILISTDYSGSGDPSTASWTELNATLSSGDYEWVASGDVDISSFTGEAAYIAFQYESSGTESGECAVWEIDNIEITGEALDVEEFAFASQLSLYPNPSTGFVKVENNNTFSIQLNIYNFSGQLVFESMANTGLQQLNLNELNEGIYFIEFINKNNNETAIQKLIIQ